MTAFGGGTPAPEEDYAPRGERPFASDRLPGDVQTGRADGVSGGMPSPPGMSLRCEDLGFSYGESRSLVPALRGVGFELAAGCCMALLGASGSGKSTLLNVIKGLEESATGVVALDGVPRGSAGFAQLQRRVGLVFQTPELQLFASSAREDVAFGPRQLGWAEEDVGAAVDEAMALVGLPRDEFGGRHPYALSGGEQRRLALAGVLAMRPRLLLLDEPFVSLDPATRRELARILARLRETGVTLMLATHDVDLAWALSDELLVLEDGHVSVGGRWDAGEPGRATLAAAGLREPFLIGLWRRLGREPEEAPRTAAEAAEALR